MCDRWRDSFDAFLADMGSRPPGHTLDRIDNDKPYEPGNCRWATVREQNNNKRTNHRITANGESKTITEWARDAGVSSTAVRRRLANESPDEAVSAGNRNPRRLLTHKGRTMSMSAWARRLGLGIMTLHMRLRAGWSVHRALTTPCAGRPDPLGTLLTHDGVTRTLREWATMSGLPSGTVRKRLRVGWTADRAVFEAIDVSKHHRGNA